MKPPPNILMPGYVHKFTKKIAHCAEVLYEAGAIPKPTRSALALYLGIPIPTLKSACQAESVSIETEQKISDGCNFSKDDPRWVDRDRSDDERRSSGAQYSGRDKPSDFLRMLRRSWNLPSESALVLRGRRPESVDVMFAAFAISDFGQSTQPDGSICAFLELDIRLLHHEEDCAEDEFAYGFKKVTIRLDIPENIKIIDWLGKKNPVALSNATLVARGTIYHPLWDIEVMDGLLEGEYCTNGDLPLFKLSDANQNTKFTAVLIAHLHDGSLRRSDGHRPRGKEKERLIELLMAKSLGPINNGRITLSTQDLYIISENEDREAQ